MVRSLRARSRPRTAAFLIALAMVLIAAGVIIDIAAHRHSGRSESAANDPNAAPISDIRKFIGDGNAGRGRLQFVDPRNPSRVARELEYDRLDPLPQGRFAITEPRAWVYFNDGRVLYVRAKSGKIKKPPKSNDVESGQFEGWVVALLFAPRPGASTPGGETRGHIINPETDRPILVAVTESLAFDRTTGEFTTPDRINISTPDWEVQGVGLHAVYNDVKQRPDASTILRGEYALIKSGKSVSPAPAPLAPAQPVGAQDTDAPVAPDAAAGATPHTASEIFYHAEFRDSVVFMKRAQSIASDTLDVWAHLVDGRLPPGALGERTGNDKQAAGMSAPNEKPSVPGDASSPKPQESAAKPTEDSPSTLANGSKVTSVRQTVLTMRQTAVSAHPPLAEADDDDALLLWTGPLTLTPLDTTPMQLNFEQVALKFAANPSREVRLADARRGSSGRCTVIDYGATTQNLLISGVGETGVSLAHPKGTLQASRFEQNIRTGDAHVPGGGMLTDESGVKQIVWSEQADFRFDTGRATTGHDDQVGITGIKEAMFTGGVVASDESSMAAADFIHAWFKPSDPAKSQSLVDRVVLEGHAHGQKKGKDPLEVDRLRAERIDVAFKPDENGSRSDPSVLTATGAVEAGRTEHLRRPDASTSSPTAKAATELRTSTLRSDLLEADLRIDPSDPKGKRIEVASATAQGHFHFERTDGLSADSDLMRADALKKIVDLSGENMILNQGRARITGTQARLDDSEKSLFVFGAGRLDQESDPAQGDSDVSSVHVTWTKEMRFEDASGLVECVGDTFATSTSSDGLSVNKAQGERIVLHLAPKSANGADRRDDDVPSKAGDITIHRRVRLAEIFGKPGAPGGLDPEPAKVEYRHYDQPSAAGAERRLNRLRYVEGMIISADMQADTFTVPTAGRALMVDQAEKSSSPSVAQDKSPVLFPDSSHGRGNSLFTWSGSMVMDHRAGRLEIHKGTRSEDQGVRLVHKPLGGGQPMTLDCDALTALFQNSPDGGEKKKDAEQQRLVRALAHGDVTAESEGGIMKLLAEDLDYDAVKSTIDAWAPEDERVTFFDQRHVTPLIARKLHYDLNTGEPFVTEPLPITMPIKRK